MQVLPMTCCNNTQEIIQYIYIFKWETWSLTYKFLFINWKVDDTKKLMCHISQGTIAVFLFFFNEIHWTYLFFNLNLHQIKKKCFYRSVAMNVIFSSFLGFTQNRKWARERIELELMSMTHMAHCTCNDTNSIIYEYWTAECFCN